MIAELKTAKVLSARRTILDERRKEKNCSGKQSAERTEAELKNSEGSVSAQNNS